MKTLNRPTASVALTTKELAELGHRLRQLWSAHLRAMGDEREQLIVELSEVDTQIERLSIRAQCELFTSADRKILVQAVAQIEELERTWHQLSSLDRTSMAVAA